MSVINNVLKGLDSRESQFTPIEIPTIEPEVVVKRDYRPGIFIAGVVMLLLAGGWYYLQKPKFSDVGPPPVFVDNVEPLVVNETVSPEIAAVAPTEPPAPEPVMAGSPELAPTPLEAVPEPANQIAGLQIRESETELELQFLLREQVVAYLKNRDQNSFSYHLRDIESQIVAPSISGNRWIRELTIVTEAGGVDVNFVTAPDILVETRQLPQDGNSTWVINLRQAQPEKQPAPVSAQSPAPSQTAPVASSEQAVEEDVVAVAEEPEPAQPVTLSIKPTNPGSKTVNQLDYAVELMNSGRYDDAEALLRGLIGSTHDYSARKHLMALYSRMSRPQRLRSLLQVSLLKYPEDPLFETEYAHMLFAEASYQEVIALFADRGNLDGKRQALLAASYQRLDQHAAAIVHYRHALQTDLRNARNWVGLGISLEQEAAFIDALAAYQQASELGTLNSRLAAFAKRRMEQLRQVLD